MDSSNKILVVGLDGYDQNYAESLMARGELPYLAKVKADSACFELDHGSARRTGLAFEHFSSGLSPEAGDRWSALYFDKVGYDAWQEDVRFEPFTRYLNARTVVFDTPYFDLEKDPDVRGVVSWGAHDPGTARAGQPAGLVDEMLSRFGAYPAPEWIYGFAWPCAEKCRVMGEKLCAAVEKRKEITNWLFRERLPDWDIAITVVSELHSASEALWHGVDASHPLHNVPSAEAAATSMESVYKSVDKLVGDLQTSFPGVTLIFFSMHGMGPNNADISSMALLPELMLRKYTGKSMLDPKPEWLANGIDYPPLGEADSWRIPLINQGGVSTLKRKMIDRVTPLARKLLPNQLNGSQPGFARSSRLNWMPAIHYKRYWKNMPAFALPAFYDGRIRINLKSREKNGQVALQDYHAFREDLAEFLRGCLDAQTGRPAVRHIEFSSKADPLDLDASDADIIVEWDFALLALAHPDIGTIGPLPYRRPGGHTGGHGVFYISGSSMSPGKHGTRSAFDVVPTLFDLAGERYPAHLSGASVLS
jgi:predicted AlkP superfamily phosphohydrolase/phosphomutase